VIVTPPDFAAFAAANGIPYPSDPATRAALTPAVVAWKQQQDRRERSEGALTGLAGLGIATGVGVLGYNLLNRSPQTPSNPPAAPAATSAPPVPAANPRSDSLSATEFLSNYAQQRRQRPSSNLRIVPQTQGRRQKQVPASADFGGSRLGNNYYRNLFQFSVAGRPVQIAARNNPGLLQQAAKQSVDDLAEQYKNAVGDQKQALGELLTTQTRQEPQPIFAKNLEELTKITEQRANSVPSQGKRRAAAFPPNQIAVVGSGRNAVTYTYQPANASGVQQRSGTDAIGGHRWFLASPNNIITAKYGATREELEDLHLHPEAENKARYKADHIPYDHQGIVLDPRFDPNDPRHDPNLSEQNLGENPSDPGYVHYKGGLAGSSSERNIVPLETPSRNKKTQWLNATETLGRPVNWSDIADPREVKGGELIKSDNDYSSRNNDTGRDFVTELETDADRRPGSSDYDPGGNFHDASTPAAALVSRTAHIDDPERRAAAIDLMAQSLATQQFGPSAPRGFARETADRAKRLAGITPVAPPQRSSRSPLPVAVGVQERRSGDGLTLPTVASGLGLVVPPSERVQSALLHPDTYGTADNPAPALDPSTGRPVVSAARHGDHTGALSRLPNWKDKSAALNHAVLINEIVAQDMPHILERARRSNDPEIRAAAAASGHLDYGGARSGPLTSALGRAIDPLVRIASHFEEGGVGTTPRYDIPVDTAERLALKAARGADLQQLLNDQIRSVDSIGAAISFLDRESRIARSVSAEMPHVAASRLVEHFINTAQADDGTQLGALLGTINRYSNSGLFDEKRGMVHQVERNPVALTLGSRLVGREIQDANDLQRELISGAVTSTPEFFNDAIDLRMADESRRKRLADPSNTSFGAVVAQAAGNFEPRTYPLNKQLSAEYDSRLKALSSASKAEEVVHRAAIADLVGDQVAIDNSRPEIEAVIHGYNTAAFKGGKQLGLVASSGPFGTGVKVADMPTERLSFGTTTQLREDNGKDVDDGTYYAFNDDERPSEFELSAGRGSSIPVNQDLQVKVSAQDEQELDDYAYYLRDKNRRQALAAPGAQAMSSVPSDSAAAALRLAKAHLQQQRRADAAGPVAPSAVWRPAAGFETAARVVGQPADPQEEARLRAAAVAATMDERTLHAVKAAPATWLEQGVPAPGQAYLNARIKAMRRT